MAEKHSEAKQNGCRSVAESDTQNEVNSMKQTKRCSSTSPSTAPPNKSPRTDFQSASSETPEAEEGQTGTDKLEMQAENMEGPSSPSARRKSWRRATITRRSLPAIHNPYQVLCRSIDTSLSQKERLEKLMEASMKLAIERTENSLQSVPNTSPESFKKHIKHMQKEWGYLAKSIRDDKPGSHQLPAGASDSEVQRTMEQQAINRLQAESDSWEALLNKHRSKLEELERKVEQGKNGGVSLDSTSVARSSQSRFIQSKPDYHAVLCRQQPMLHAMALIMDTQRKMVGELLSIKEQSQLLVKETSGRLAAKSGLQDLSLDLIKKNLNYIVTHSGGKPIM